MGCNFRQEAGAGQGAEMNHEFKISFFEPVVGIGWIEETFFASIWFINFTIKKKVKK